MEVARTPVVGDGVGRSASWPHAADLVFLMTCWFRYSPDYPLSPPSGSAAFPNSGLPSSPIAALTPSDTYVRPCAASSIDEATSRSWQYATFHPYKDHHFDLDKLTSHLPDHRNLNLLDSCNGLLLLGCREDRSYKSMIVCNPFRNDEINWVTIHMNAGLKQLPLQRKFISAKLVSHRASRSFKCLLFFEDQQLNELGAQSIFWCTVLCSNGGQSHHIYQLPPHVPPPFHLYDVAFDNNYPKVCIIREDKKDHLISSALNKRRNGRVRSLMGVSRGLAHFAFCDEHELHIWTLEREAGKRVWKP
ncbi:unnamed protein product [Musa textilis]